jgi:hypothetical protein
MAALVESPSSMIHYVLDNEFGKLNYKLSELSILLHERIDVCSPSITSERWSIAILLAMVW